MHITGGPSLRRSTAQRLAHCRLPRGQTPVSRPHLIAGNPFDHAQIRREIVRAPRPLLRQWPKLVRLAWIDDELYMRDAIRGRELEGGNYGVSASLVAASGMNLPIPKRIDRAPKAAAAPARSCASRAHRSPSNRVPDPLREPARGHLALAARWRTHSLV